MRYCAFGRNSDVCDVFSLVFLEHGGVLRL